MPAGFEGVGWRLSYEGHTVDALALRGEEGRSRLRKAPASCQTNCDPEMSEWGNPAVRQVLSSQTEFIGLERRTWRTETSK